MHAMFGTFGQNLLTYIRMCPLSTLCAEHSIAFPQFIHEQRIKYTQPKKKTAKTIFITTHESPPRNPDHQQ